MTILGWIIIGAVVIVFSTLYWRALAERNHLTCYVGMLLLDDSVRAAHKQNLERFLLESKAANAQALSTSALVAIQGMARRLAAGDPKAPATSSVLAFHGLVWNRKQALEKEAK